MMAQLAIEDSIPNVQTVSERFDIAVQCITTDRDPANLKAELGIQRSHRHFRRLHLPCNVHKLSSSMTYMFNLTDAEVSGMVNYGLLFRPAGAAAKFRDCIMDEIESKLQVVIGPPPAGEVQTYRHQVYDLFLSSSHSNEKVRKFKQNVQRLTLDFFLNGDIQDEDVIFWYAPFEVTRETALQVFRKYVPRALFPSSLLIFPRHRWHGAEIPVDCLGLLASHHNLLKYATIRYLALFGWKPKSVLVGAPGAGAGGWTYAAASLQPLDDGPPIQEEQGQDESALALPVPTANASQNPDVDSAQQWEQFNRSVRSAVGAWVEQDSFETLPVMRLAMTPAVDLMFKFLDVAGDAWESEQNFKHMSTQSRKFRVVEAWNGEDVKNAWSSFARVMHQAIPAVPAKAWKRSVSALLFRQLSRIFCAVHQLIRLPRSDFPYRLFSSLGGGDDQISEMLAAPRCLFDIVSSDIVAKYPTVADMKGSEAQCLLEFLAFLTCVDVSQIECRHAAIRRCLEASSVQTWRANFSELSAKFACRQAGAREEDLATKLTGKATSVPKKGKKKTEKKEGTATCCSFARQAQICSEAGTFKGWWCPEGFFS